MRTGHLSSASRLWAAMVLMIVVASVGTSCFRPRPKPSRTTTTVATPATTATTVAGHDHGDDHGGTADDKGWSKLANGHQHERGEVPLDEATQKQLDQQLAVTAQLLDRYPTVADAVNAGARRAGPFSPGLGTHYFNPSTRGIVGAGPLTEAQLLSPMLVYRGSEPSDPLIGFMYMAATATAPEGFVGPNDHWHYHSAVCIAFEAAGLYTPLPSDADFTREQCAAAGGSYIANTGYMAHVWSVPGWENPDGLFAELNPTITCPDGTYYKLPDDEYGAHRTSMCLNQ